LASEQQTTVRQAAETIADLLGSRSSVRLVPLFEGRYEQHKTLRQIGLEFGVGPERVRQVNAKALRMLRHPARRDIYRTLDNEALRTAIFPNGEGQPLR
jgi:RNA polymerase primary sigma factor